MPNRPPKYRPPGLTKPPSQLARGTTTQRGYGYRWQQLRVRVLADEPLCRPCREAGLTVEATCVDHIVPKVQGGTDDLSNLQPTCDLCNARKSVTDKAGKRSKPSS